MRIGLGCMRLSTEPTRDDERGLAVLHAALDAGVDVLDTAHAYALGPADMGHNERLLARALSNATSGRPMGRVSIVTKCGMRRDGGQWLPAGRARHIEEDVDASVAALGGLPIDLLLLHVPDPRVPIATSARALARARERGHAARIGVSNVSRKQLEEAVRHAPIAAVEVALGAHDDLAVRSGVVAYCLANGLDILAHAPLGGPTRAGKLARDTTLARLTSARARDGRGGSAAELVLAYLLAVHERIQPVVGARRPATITSIVAATRLALDEDELTQLDARFPALGGVRRPHAPPRGVVSGGGPPRDVVVMMGIQGAGKSRTAQALVEQGYERLNRDQLGGTLRGIAKRLDERLAAGASRVVLDNTYVTRATRSDVLSVARAHGVGVRCVFFDTPPEEARVNVVARMLERFGRLLEPAELASLAREDAAALGPGAIQRMVRDLEPPTDDEGFLTVERVAFVREHDPATVAPGVAISLDASDADVTRILGATTEDTAVLLFGWRPGLDDAAHARTRARAEVLARATGRAVDVAVCMHLAGAPVCWCRPPLPGLWLAFARARKIDPRRSQLFGSRDADEALARTLGLPFRRASA